MLNLSAPNAIALLALLGAAACHDGQVSSAPKAPLVPPTPGNQAFVGTVDGTTISFTPVEVSSSVIGPGIDPMVYGSQGVNVTVYGTVESLVTLPGSKTWKIRMGMRNLLGYPIGANYATAVAGDSSGVFLGVSSLPAVNNPIPCAGCAVTITNFMGSGMFLAVNPYFWYNGRPSAMTTSPPGTDTTKNEPLWNFTTAQTQVNGFKFVVMVKAAWPPAQETNATVAYNGTSDSTPDIDAEPRWQRFHATNMATTPGLAVFDAGVGLKLTSANNTTSIYFSRDDSLGTRSAFMDVRMRDTVTTGSNAIQAVFGFAEPMVNNQNEIFIGVSQNRVTFVDFNQGSGQWAQNPLGGAYNGGGFDGRAFHTYRLRKIGTMSAMLCVDGMQRLTLLYGNQVKTPLQFASRSVVFGTDGRNGGAASRWTSVSYTIGSDGGGCT